ncbi:hypothetical protein DFJ43DRAFT_1043925 [Lentinula guzmanii]|uniref:Uncharacterized protein n=1 Tax=Lentinula guzmanii TaxID=2804957 RepID=A0AA38MVL4_9AGAR|nr:hypothetical protein DFJ43DRAFT_1043925 [Lentinula guzmanii]
MYYCHVSRVPFTSSKAVEFAHILLPKASANQTAVVVEFILGMAVRTLCINSRLFIMPLLVDVHRMVDAHKIFFLPSKAVIDLLTGYFRQVLELRRKGVESSNVRTIK